MDFQKELEQIDAIFREVHAKLHTIQGICDRMYQNLDKLPPPVDEGQEKVREAARKAIDRVGTQPVEDYFSELGIASVSGVEPDQYAIVIEALEDL